MLASALVVAVVTLPLACGSFGAADPDAGDGGLPEAEPPESGAGDARVDAATNPTDCVDLTKGSNGYVPSAVGGATTQTSANGLEVSFPTSTGVESAAAWRRTFPVGNATGVKLRIEAVVDLTTGVSPNTWYTTFAGLSHGDESQINSASFVHVAIAAATAAAAASMDMNLFPGGTGGKPAPTVTKAIGVVALGRHDVTALVDVRWSATNAANASGQLDDGSAQPLVGATLQGGPVPSWTLYLGGSASGQPRLTILFKRVCITLQ
jgi:hypothetical protein